MSLKFIIRRNITIIGIRKWNEKIFFNINIIFLDKAAGNVGPSSNR